MAENGDASGAAWKERERLATTKRQRSGQGSAGGGDGERPKLRSSHAERLGESAKKRKKAPRATSGPRPQGRPRPKQGHLLEAPRPTRGPGLRARKPKPSSSQGEGAGGTASDSARELAVAIAIAAIEKKAVGLEVLDVAGKVDYADFLVIMTGRSDRQVAALAQGIEEALRKKSIRPLAVEGLPLASWVLMDFGDVVVHVFQDDARSLYDIEGLWMDARRVPVPVPEEVR